MLNNEFHQTMFSACNNSYLAGMIQRVWVETLGIRCYAIGDPVLLVRPGPSIARCSTPSGRANAISSCNFAWIIFGRHCKPTSARMAAGPRIWKALPETPFDSVLFTHKRIRRRGNVSEDAPKRPPTDFD